MSNVRDTSIESYEINEATGLAQSKRDRILALVSRHPGLTRRQIAITLNYDTATVAGTINGLIQAGDLKDGDRIKCPITGRAAHAVLVPTKQIELFKERER